MWALHLGRLHQRVQNLAGTSRRFSHAAPPCRPRVLNQHGLYSIRFLRFRPHKDLLQQRARRRAHHVHHQLIAAIILLRRLDPSAEAGGLQVAMSGQGRQWTMQQRSRKPFTVLSQSSSDSSFNTLMRASAASESRPCDASVRTKCCRNKLLVVVAK